MTLPTDPATNPTGLDYLAAYQALYPGAAQDGKRLQDLSPQTLRLVDRAARLIVSTRADTRLQVAQKIREIHKPFGIYDECGHEHTQEELDDPDSPVVEIDAVGLTCDEGLMYRVCEACCIEPGWAEGFQTEVCATKHEHGMNDPICATIAALEA